MIHENIYISIKNMPYSARRLLMSFLCALRSAFQKNLLYSLRCFHHCGEAVKLPFFTFAISNTSNKKINKQKNQKHWNNNKR